MTEKIEQLPPLRDVIGRFGLMAKKNLGQNFLLDLNLTAKIARAAGNVTGKNIIEIGPGPGGLTRALLLTDAVAVYAIERDDRCVAALQELVDAADGRFHLLADDAMKVNLETVCPAPRVLAANLPYNIATTLLTNWFEQLHLFDSMTLMFQKEVADRITADTRCKNYGRLSVLSQWLCAVEVAFELPPSAFTPPPKVTSSVVHFITRRDRTDGVEIKTMETVTAAAFGQRRKMLRQSLKRLNVDTEKLMEMADITPTARAEEIDVAGFIRLAQSYMKLR
jgi:16S rRNA (adenine1518-N6/adenine1519-N6)-dimethyltransferase